MSHTLPGELPTQPSGLPTRLDNTIRQARDRQRGQVSAVIALIVVLIVGIAALAGAFREIASLFQSSDSAAIIREFDSVSTATQNTYENSPTGYANVSTANLANSKTFAQNMIVGTPPAATGLQDVFHGQINIYPGAAGGAAIDNAFTVVMNNVSETACVKDVTQDLGNEVQNVAVAQADPGAFIAPASPTVERLTLAEASADCKAGRTNALEITVVP